MLKFGLLFVLVTLFGAHYCHAYSARADASTIAEYRQQQNDPAVVARKLVHRANWAPVGTISTNNLIADFPMVNVISIDDCDIDGNSTGRIHFLLTDRDYTGKDWKNKNNVTMLFSDEQTLNCKEKNVDPMEPTCARTIISGKIIELNPSDESYENAKKAFIKRHPAAENWLKHHHFYLCEFDIANIFVLDHYGGPKNVSPDDYYKAKIEPEELASNSEKDVYITINQMD